MTEPAPYTEPPAAPIRRLSRVLGAIALLLAIVIFAFGVVPPLFLNSTGTIYEVPCTILASDVAQRVGEEPWGNGFRRFVNYEPIISFKYTFQGKEYVSNKVSSVPDEAMRSRNKAYAIAATYERDKQDVCFVNERNPGEAVLILNQPRTPYLYAFAAAILGIFGILGIANKGNV